MSELKIGCCGGMQQVQLYCELGFDYIEPPVVSVVDDKDFFSFAKCLERYSIKAEVFNCFLPASLPIVGPDVSHTDICNYLNKVLPRIERLGGEIVVFGSGKARNIPQGFPKEVAYSQLTTFLDLAAEAAGDKVRILIEPLSQTQTNFLNRVDETRKLCQNQGWRIGLLADLFHLTEENEPLENLVPVSQLGHIHIPFPEDKFPLADFLGMLKSRHYKRRVSLEDNGGLLAGGNQDQRALLAKALAEVRALS